MAGRDQSLHVWGLQKAQYLKDLHPVLKKSEFIVGGTGWLLGSSQTVEYHLPQHA